MQNQSNIKGLALACDNNSAFLFYLKKNTNLKISMSQNGSLFSCSYKRVIIKEPGKSKKKQDILKYQDIRISKIHDDYFLTYKKTRGKKTFLYGALSKDLFHWKNIGLLPNMKETAVIASDYLYDNNYVMYFGDKTIKIAFSKDLKKWKKKRTISLKPRKNKFDNYRLQPGNVFIRPEGIILLYYAIDKTKQYSIGAALFDKDNPNSVIWRKDAPLWKQKDQLKNQKIRPLGIVNLNNNLIAYFENEESGEIFAISLPELWYLAHPPKLIKEKGARLHKSSANPIIEPIAQNEWESSATFNPAAFRVNGKTYIIYRAMGPGHMSMLGCAISKNGIHIEERTKEPIYGPREDFEGCQGTTLEKATVFMSGGGWGGCEDPRITLIDNRLYLIYVAYDGCRPPRVALSSISLKDFLAKAQRQNNSYTCTTSSCHLYLKNPSKYPDTLQNFLKKPNTNLCAKCKSYSAVGPKNWNWTKPILISPPGVVDKNACILPEKINNKYVIFHRIYPNILIDFVDNLNFSGKGKKFLKGEFKIRPRPLMWDSKKIGVGPTPLKTKKGWLVIYQAVGSQEPGQYKIGAMLLKLTDPTKVLHRSNQPILEPTEWYENQGHKSGVAYPCGAVIDKGQLFIYYGGADKFVCAATASLDKFLDDLIKSEEPKLKKIVIK